MAENNCYYFCGIGGSGMFPLAMIVAARGHDVAGSDRGHDQGRSAEKFQWMQDRGITLHPQDGSGVREGQILVASAAVEDSVPDVAAAKRLGLPRVTRAELNAQLFNAAQHKVGIGGTSGKSTVTGMIGWILERLGRRPTVMNGAVMRNFSGPDNPYASALAGDIASYVSEVDESDGSIALYQPKVAVVTNISLDHKSLEELHALFGDFATKAETAVINADDAESAPLLAGANVVAFGFADTAMMRGSNFTPLAGGSAFTATYQGQSADLRLAMPGRHNAANALAAMAAVAALGVDLKDAAAALAEFKGLARRYEVLGEANGVTIIDDFGHNPDKVAATLSAAKDVAGRLLLFFQPHGYGPLRQMGKELAASFANGMDAGDILTICDPVYFGGTVDRSIGSDTLVDDIRALGADARHIPARADCGAAILHEAQPGDRIIILGARDDSLTEFAADLLGQLAARA
jgi:UDP-N-acetylmuramate--alanine ligase